MALQSDLTAVTVGAVPAATEHLLRAAADREGVGVWRFSRASVRRALDGGQTGDRLLEELAALSTGDLPQVLTRLIRDVARGHGNLRIHPCGCCLVASEESVLAEVLGEGLDLHRVAPTVAVGPGSATDLVHDLRRLGYAPVVDPVRGTTRLEGRAKGRKRPTDRRGVDSPPPVPPSTEPGVAGVAGLALFDLPDPSQGRRDPLETARQLCRDPARTDRRIEAAVNRLVSYDDGQRCHTRLTADELRLLARAQEDGLAVIIEKSRSLISSATSRYLLDEVSIEHAQVRGWDPRWESEATFRVSDLTSVQAATTAVSLS